MRVVSPARASPEPVVRGPVPAALGSHGQQELELEPIRNDLLGMALGRQLNGRRMVRHDSKGMRDGTSSRIQMLTPHRSRCGCRGGRRRLMLRGDALRRHLFGMSAPRCRPLGVRQAVDAPCPAATTRFGDLRVAHGSKPAGQPPSG
jgi:hypothetical protein